MSTKINCKHGLDKRQELEARKLRLRIEQGDERILKEYKDLWEQWFKCPKEGFTVYLQKNHIVHYSAFVRACNSQGIEEICRKIDQ